MSLPTWIAPAAAFAAGIGGSVNLPSGRATDDVLVLILETNAEAPGNNPPVGWTECPGSPLQVGTPGAAGAVRLSAFWCRVDGTEVAPDVGDSGDHQAGRIACIRGCRAGNPFDGSATGISVSTGTAVTIAGGSSTTPDCLVLLLLVNGIDSGSGQFSGVAVNTDLANLTKRWDVSTTVNNGGGHCVQTGELATAGAFGATTATLLAASHWAGLALVMASQAAAVGSGAVPAILSEGL